MLYITLFNKGGLLLDHSQHRAMGRLSTSVEPSTRCAECGSVEDADLTCSNCKSVSRHKESKTQKVVSIELRVIFKVVNIWNILSFDYCIYNHGWVRSGFEISISILKTMQEHVQSISWLWMFMVGIQPSTGLSQMRFLTGRCLRWCIAAEAASEHTGRDIKRTGNQVTTYRHLWFWSM